MAGVRKKSNKQSKKFQGYFIDWTGKRKFFVGTISRRETLDMARAFEDEHRQVRLGYRPPPTSATKQRGRLFADVVQEYLMWGRLQGRRDGAAWTPEHTRQKRDLLEKWRVTLGLQTLADLDGFLPKVESSLRAMSEEGLSGNTLRARARALVSLCRWARKRGYMENNPLENLAPIDGTPQVERRALSPAEVAKIFRVCPPWRRLLYAVAACSGLRLRELRALSIQDLDVQGAQLHLRAKSTKNRRASSQPLPVRLVAQLIAFVDSAAAPKLYLRAGTRALLPENPLLFVPTHSLRLFTKDLARAGIPKVNAAGRLDFHCWRVSFVTASLEAGASAKEAMRLARHTTPQLTLNTYARARDERLAELVESVGGRLLPDEICATGVHDDPTPADQVERKGLSERDLAFSGRSEGLCPHDASPVLFLDT
ncbi:MAG: tyrosine-type recombinase/integrase [Phycisphaerae bacterium]|nr:tyrosine-type recombinase/integrase [Phycisphaerae bacterium]